MGPQSLINLFSYKSDKTEYHLRDLSSRLCLPKPRTDNMKNSFMYDGAKILFPKTFVKASHFLPFDIKSLLTFFEF